MSSTGIYFESSSELVDGTSGLGETIHFVVTLGEESEEDQFSLHCDGKVARIETRERGQRIGATIDEIMITSR